MDLMTEDRMESGSSQVAFLYMSAWVSSRAICG